MQVLLSTYFQLLDLSGLFLTACLIYIFSYRKTTGLQPIHLTLTGIGFSFALSGTMIVIISSAERVKVDFIAKWIAGNIWGDDWVFVLAILPWLAILIPFILYKANRLNILALNEPVAIGVGIELEKERRSLLLATVALAPAPFQLQEALPLSVLWLRILQNH